MELTNMLPSLLLLIGVVLLVFLTKISLLFFSKKQQNEPEYRLETNLLTPAEMVFFEFLLANLESQNYHVATKVRLADVFNCVSKGRAFIKGFNKIKAKHFDFVIVSKKDAKILLAIELDDRTHNFGKAKKNDKFKNELCKQTSLKLIRIPVQQSYNESTLALFSI